MNDDCNVCQRNQSERPTWGPGPWQDEPDHMAFEHAGLPCIIHRGGFGGWCGYAAVPPGHPLHGKGYEDVDVDIHGGLTYAGECKGHICHIAKPGEPDNVHWFGFDCAHAFELCPRSHAFARANPSLGFDPDKHYWTQAEVIEETKRLAEQLAALANEEDELDPLERCVRCGGEAEPESSFCCDCFEESAEAAS